MIQTGKQEAKREREMKWKRRRENHIYTNRHEFRV